MHAVAELARTIGAHAIAREAQAIATDDVQEARRLCLRLEQHLFEERRALIRTRDEARRHLDAIFACMTAFEQVIASMHADHAIAAFGSELATERRKLVMAQKADLLAELGERVLLCTAARRDLDTAASAYADEIGEGVLRTWSQTLYARSDRHVATFAEELVRRARVAFGENAESVLTPAFAGVVVSVVIASPAIERAPHVIPSRWTWLESDARVRERAGKAACDRLTTLLERGSAQIVACCLRDHELATEQVTASFLNGLDQFAMSASLANARAREARAKGRRAVTQAYERIDIWLRRLADEQRRLG